MNKENPIKSPRILTPLEACVFVIDTIQTYRTSGLTPTKDYSEWKTVELLLKDTIAAEEKRKVTR